MFLHTLKKGKAATGKPTRYEPAYCYRVVDLMAEGHSLKGTAIALRISRKTLYNWGAK